MLDFLIIGQGLAGSVLSHTLSKHKCKVKVFDNPQKKSASISAAGIFNPITGRQMRKTWKAEALFDSLLPFYQNLESILGSKLIHKIPVIRIFSNQKQLNDWHGQMDRPGVMDFIGNSQSEIENIIADMGYISLKRSGYLDVPKFINDYKKHLLSNNSLIESDFEYDRLNIGPDQIEYEGIKAKKLIFCQGFESIFNPFFKNLPLIPNKGEMLSTDIPALKKEYIYNKNGFLMPRPNGDFWVGATYKVNDLSEKISTESIEVLKSKIRNITDQNFTVQKGLSGIRPTVKDRRPLIGIHPKYEQIGIFNGLGSKGVSLAPYWSEHFAKHLINDQKLDEEVNIKRFNSFI